MKLTPRDRRIIDLFALGKSKHEISAELGLSMSQLNRKIGSQIFKAQVASKQSRMFENSAKGYMKTLMNKAYAVIETILEDDEERSSIKLEAAKFVVDHVVGKATNTTEFKGTLLVDVMNRLDLMKRDGPVIEAQILSAPDEPSFIDQATDLSLLPENVATAKALAQPMKDAVDAVMETLDFETSIVGVRDGKGS